MKGSRTRSTTTKRLAAMQLWPPLIEAGGGAGLRRLVQVGVLEDDVGVGAPELEHHLLEAGPGLRGHRPTRGGAAGEGHRRHLGGLDELRHPGRADEDGPEEVLGQPGVAEDLLDGQGAPGHVGGVLQERRVAGHEGRRREAEDLPQGEVPGHDRQDDPQGLEADVAAGGVGGHGLAGQEALRPPGVVVADPGALVGLGPALGQGLAHLQGHQAGQALPGAPGEAPRPAGGGWRGPQRRSAASPRRRSAPPRGSRRPPGVRFPDRSGSICRSWGFGTRGPWRAHDTPAVAPVTSLP